MIDNDKIKRVLDSLEDTSIKIEDKIEKEVIGKLHESGLIKDGVIKVSDSMPYLIGGSKEFTVQLVRSVLEALIDDNET